MKTYELNMHNLQEYIFKITKGDDTFLKNTLALLVRNTAEKLQQKSVSYTSIYNRETKVYAPIYVYDLIDILNDAMIDLTYQDLFDNKILEEKKNI